MGQYRILRLAEVQERTGECTSSIYAKMASGEFPRAVKLGKRAVGWIEAEIDEHIATKVAARDAKLATKSQGRPTERAAKPAQKRSAGNGSRPTRTRPTVPAATRKAKQLPEKRTRPAL
jgi:predicted DNA-binding transcriptional regulator AlpA